MVLGLVKPNASGGAFCPHSPTTISNSNLNPQNPQTFVSSQSIGENQYKPHRSISGCRKRRKAMENFETFEEYKNLFIAYSFLVLFAFNCKYIYIYIKKK